MSPASGDVSKGLRLRVNLKRESFHSINVPSEWGRFFSISIRSLFCVSIQLMSPASGDYQCWVIFALMVYVSIQLMSPASGDFKGSNLPLVGAVIVSIQLMSPASGDCQTPFANQ